MSTTTRESQTERAERIVIEVCAQHRVSPHELRQASKTARMIRLRQDIIYRMKTETVLTNGEIGNYVGLTNHTSVLHHWELIQKRNTNDEFERQLNSPNALLFFSREHGTNLCTSFSSQGMTDLMMPHVVHLHTTKLDQWPYSRNTDKGTYGQHLPTHPDEFRSQFQELLRSLEPGEYISCSVGIIVRVQGA